MVQNKSNADLQALNSALQSKSYVSGYTPTKADVDNFQQIASQPGADLPHLLRWYKHIASFTAPERQKWTGTDGGASSSGGAQASASAAADDDEEIDLFADSDEEEDEEKERIKSERLKAYADKKSKKPALVAKSNIILDVKPWDDETDMAALEKNVRGISQDGLIWGPSKILPVAYGIQKLQISCVVEDDKVGTDFLEEQITGFEDFVQSVDVVAFNKI